MVRSIIVYRSFLLLISIVQLAVSTSLSSSVTVGLTTLSLTPLFTRVVVAADETPAETAMAEGTAATAAKECKESDETCTSPDASDLSSDTTSDADENQTNEDNTPATNANGDRVITHAELAKHVGAGGASPTNTIWLSILGKVYDVTTGEDFYGEAKGSYKFYSGRDASPCFSTGNNTPEGASENIEEWDDKKLLGVWEWGSFYENHETYKYLGVLADSMYYDKEGNVLPVRQEIIKRANEAKKLADEEKEKKRTERMAAREKRKKDNAEKAKKGRYS